MISLRCCHDGNSPSGDGFPQIETPNLIVVVEQNVEIAFIRPEMAPSFRDLLTTSYRIIRRKRTDTVTAAPPRYTTEPSLGPDSRASLPVRLFHSRLRLFCNTFAFIEE